MNNIVGAVTGRAADVDDLNRFLDFTFPRRHHEGRGWLPPCGGIVGLTERIRQEPHDLWRTPGIENWTALRPRVEVLDRELYVCISTLRGNAHQNRSVGYSRKRTDLKKTYLLVADDVGTAPDSKVRPEAVALQPTYKLETSPGNYQWGFVLSECVAPDEAEPVINGMIDARLTDAGAGGAYRVVRVPGSINRKNPEAPFAAMLRDFYGERRFTLQQVVSGLGITPRIGRPPREVGATRERRVHGESGPRTGRLADKDEVRSALAAIPQEGANALPRAQWINVCLALKFEYGDDGFPLWEEFSRRYADNTDDEITRCWSTCHPDGDITVGSIFHMATRHGWCRQTYAANRNAALFSHLRETFATVPLAEWSTPTATQTSPVESAATSPAIISGTTGGAALRDYANANRVTSVAPAADLPPVEWLLKHVHACRYVGVTAGRGGLNKTQLSLVEAVSIATGVDLLEYGGVRKSKVLLFNKEESRLDVLKRLRAIVLHFREKLSLRHEQIDGFDFHGNLVVVSGRSLPLSLGGDERGDWTIDGEAFQAVGRLISDTGARLVVIDPLLLFHGLNENDNMQMGTLTTAFGQMAEDLDIAIEIIAHTRKGGEAGDIDNVRGASALIAHARRGRVLTRMSTKEAATLGVPVADAGYYFRIDNGKANLLPPAAKARWFRSLTIKLDNEALGRPADSYGVPECFVPRPVLDTITYEQVSAIYAAAGRDACHCRAHYKFGVSGWFGNSVASALGFEMPHERTEQHKGAVGAMKRRLQGLRQRGVLILESVSGVGSQGRSAECYRQGQLPSESAWESMQGAALGAD